MKRISANINDDEWLESLHNREFKIGSGDSITATIEQYVDLDLMNKPIENSERYSIVKIIGDIESEPDQTSLHI